MMSNVDVNDDNEINMWTSTWK